MRRLVRKPVLLALVLVLPLWIVFNNFIIATAVALLAAFFLTMCHALYTLKRMGPGKKERRHAAQQTITATQVSADTKAEN